MESVEAKVGKQVRRYCIGCGAPLHASWLFCYRCGTRQPGEPKGRAKKDGRGDSR